MLGQPLKDCLLFAGLISLCLAVHVFPVRAQEEDGQPGTSTSDNSEDWARQFLASDPLVGKDFITLDDLRIAIGDPQRRDTVIARHFSRVGGVTSEDQMSFLTEMLESDYPEVQSQASAELQRLGMLGEAIKQILLNSLLSDNLRVRQAAVVGLREAKFSDGILPREYLEAVHQFLDSEEPEVADAAYERLLNQGVATVPFLLQSFREGDLPVQLRAAKLLSKLLSSDPKSIEAHLQSEKRDLLLEDDIRATPRDALAKSAERGEPMHLARKMEDAKPTSVTVYFGTNRERSEAAPPTWNEISRLPVLILIFLLALIFSVTKLVYAQTRSFSSYLLPMFMILGIAWTAYLLRTELSEFWRVDSHPGFGPRRAADEQVFYGKCEVTIPPTHAVGAVERPLFGREDESKHVVIHRTTEFAKDSFFEAIKSEIVKLPHDDRSCFVFIHGFNVSFTDAARRTAQIHYDLNFQGIPIFFSWPSRASLRHYFSDRNEIGYSRFVIKQFLNDVRQRVDADRIHIIAHSMGADATSQAIAELGEQGKIFDQIILAAPDIDRDVFRRQLAPRLSMASNRTTMYCSSNDLALMASRTFNDAVRAGDSSRGALVVTGIDTIDASDIDTDLLGHSYYGDCLPILQDLRQLLQLNLPPTGRRLTPWPLDEHLLYWTLPDLAEWTLSNDPRNSSESDQK